MKFTHITLIGLLTGHGVPSLCSRHTSLFDSYVRAEHSKFPLGFRLLDANPLIKNVRSIRTLVKS